MSVHPRKFPGRVRTRKGCWPFLDSAAVTALERKYSVPILLTLYHGGVLRTNDLIRRIGGHPAAVIKTVRALEYRRILRRTRPGDDRRAVEIRLTVQGLELLETAMSRWGGLIRKWDRVA